MAYSQGMEFKPPFDPWTEYADHPTVDRRGLPRAQAEWLGDRVCVRYMLSRGHAYKRTQMRYEFGTLVAATEGHLVAVQKRLGLPVTQINYKRVDRVWNLSQVLDTESQG